MILFRLLTFITLIHLISGCADIFQYIRENDGSTYGLLSIRSGPVQALNVEVQLAVSARLSGSPGKITLLNTNVYEDLQANRVLQYKVFPTIIQPLPTPISIILNGRQLCAGARVSSSASILKFYNTFAVTPSKIVNANQRTSNSIQCGKRNKAKQIVTSLIIGGRHTMPHEFPWLAAFYHQKKFICSGSLISNNVIITAAHCVEDKRENAPKDPQFSRFDLGKHDILNPKEIGSVAAGVRTFILHSDWSTYSQNYHGDIAAAILSNNVQFTDFIMPICLWRHMTNHDDLVNNKGVIAGWGITEDLEISQTPRHVSLPAIADIDCLRSNHAFSYITSPATFCVGDKQGRIPCNGDSGTAYAIKSGNNYFLRGIVSAAVVDGYGDCNRYEYVVFTDVAQYTTWIKNILRANQ